MYRVKTLAVYGTVFQAKIRAILTLAIYSTCPW
jgi:hypothetical protein